MSLAKRRSNRQRRRDADAAIATGTQSWMVMIAALADQPNGVLTVRADTIERVGTQLSRYDYCIRTGKVPGTFDLTLIDLHAESTNTNHGADCATGTGSDDATSGDRAVGSETGPAEDVAREVTVRRITGDSDR